MKGNEQVIELLNEVLTAELTAINQYFIHAEMCESMGFGVLYAAIRQESIDEMKHAERLIERILYLEGHPNMSRYFPIKVGKTVDKMLDSDAGLEREAIDRLNRAISACAEVKDHGSKELLQQILADEERHIDWIEEQIELIKHIGIQNYLAQQVRPEA
jgi:bacterioferritin